MVQNPHSQGAPIENHFNYNYYQYNNYYNQGKSNSSLIKFNKSAYIGSVKKNLLPCLSNELRSNTKNKIKKNKKSSCSKSNINSSNKKSNNESTAYENLCKSTESLDLEKMVDYIVSSTKIYTRYNDNKENINNNSFNNLIDKNNDNDLIYINNSSDKKNSKKKKKILINSGDKSLKNFDKQKNNYSLCKCRKVECLKYSCSCLKCGNKCNSFCTCMNCKNKENNIFKID